MCALLTIYRGTCDSQEFTCIFCNEFICDFVVTYTQEANNKDTTKVLRNKYFCELPETLRTYIQDLQLRKLRVISSELDRISFEGSTRTKSSVFFLNKTSLKLSQNCFIDENQRHCWQYYECSSCLKIVGFILKFSNCLDQKFAQRYINKVILIKGFDNDLDKTSAATQTP